MKSFINFYIRCALRARKVSYNLSDILLKIVLKLGIRDVRFYIHYGNNAMDKKKWEKALERWHDAAQRFPRNANIHKRWQHALKRADFDAAYYQKNMFKYKSLLSSLRPDDKRLENILFARNKSPLYRKRIKSDKIRAAFIFWKPFQLEHLLPLYQKMRLSDKYEPFIFIINCADKAQATRKVLEEIFKADFNKHKIIYAEKTFKILYFFNPDIVFYQVPYLDENRLVFHELPEFVSQYARVMHVNYGYNLNYETTSTYTYYNKNIEHSYAIFCENKITQKEYIRLKAKPKLVLAGYTKQEAFLNAPYTPSEKIRILWIPHWHTNENKRTSNFLKYKDFFLELSKQENIELHFRPHPHLKMDLRRNHSLSSSDFDAYGKSIIENEGYYYMTSDGVPYHETFANVDVLISDFSTLNCEFLITKKPIIFCHTDYVWDSGKWLGNPGRELLEQCTYIAKDKQELEHFINEIIYSKKHPKQQQLIDYTERHQMFPCHDVCQYILDWIEKEISEEEGK